MDLIIFQEVFAKVMYTLIGIVVLGVLSHLVYNKIKHGKFFEDDAETEESA